MKLTLEEKVIAGVAILLVVIFGAWWIHRDGEKAGAVDQEIKASAVVVTAAKADVAAARAAAKVEVAKLVTKRTDYRAARAKIEVKGDSVIADGQRVDMPSVAAAIARADTVSDQIPPTLAKETRSDTLQAVLAGALDHHVDLLQEEKKPRIGLKTGVAIGVVGTVAVVYIGIRIIRAVAHK